MAAGRSFSECRGCKRQLPLANFSNTATGNRRQKCIECHQQGDNESTTTSSSVNDGALAAHIQVFNAFQVSTQKTIGSLESNVNRVEQNLTRIDNTLIGLVTTLNNFIEGGGQGAPRGLGAGAGAGGGPPAGNHTGEFSMTDSMAVDWVKPEVLSLVMRDQLEPEDLVKLRHLSLFCGGEVDEATQSLSVESGFVKVKSNETPKKASFIKAVSGVSAFCQLWSVFIGIRAIALRNDPSMVMGYAIHMHDIIAKSTKHPWHLVMTYHLEVHRKRINSKAPASEWLTSDMNAFVSILSTPTLAPPVAPNMAMPPPQMPTTNTGPYRSSTTNRAAPYVNNTSLQPYCHMTCMKFNRGACSGVCTARFPHRCARCYGEGHGVQACTTPNNMLPPASGANATYQAPGGSGAGRS